MFSLCNVQVMSLLLPTLVAFPVPWANVDNSTVLINIQKYHPPPTENFIYTNQSEIEINNFTDQEPWDIDIDILNSTLKHHLSFAENFDSANSTEFEVINDLTFRHSISNSARASEKQVESTEETTDYSTVNVTMQISTSEHSANQDEEDEEESEENTDIVQSLVSSFLSGLSTPEGGVDVDAIVGLIGGLSVPNDDGTYDFGGLTETLQSLLGPNADGGGSNVGAFLGGLIGAFIQGVAVPTGAKGAGILTGRLVTAVLPGLSAPPPPPEGTKTQPEQGLDSAGFFKGFLKGSSSSGNMTNNNGSPVANIKQTIFKTVFSFISSLFIKPSKSDWH